jgi:hypothetical protein
MQSYTLIDTPGFQRPRRALEWLNQVCDQRGSTPPSNRALCQSSDDCAKQFPDEVALLKTNFRGRCDTLCG